MDPMQQYNAGWRKERQVITERYIRSFGDAQLSFVLCSSTSLHPHLHQVLDEDVGWLPLFCGACGTICLPLMTLTSFSGSLTPGTINHRAKCSCLCIFPLCFCDIKMSLYSPSVPGQVFFPCHFCERQNRIRRVLDRKEQVKRDGYLFGFASSVWAFFKKKWPSLRPLSSGSWFVSNNAKSGKLNSAPEPRNSPMSTSKTSGTTWMMSV